MEGFQFADILILALIAGFVALRLRNTLGKDVGHRPDANHLRQQMSKELEERVIPLSAVAKTPAEIKAQAQPDKVFDALNEAQKAQLSPIMQQDPAFRLDEFIEGAKGAFEWVLKAFNEGDKSTLKLLLSKEVYKEFEEAMIDRTASPTRVDTTLVSLDNVSLIQAQVKGDKAQISLRFLTDQVQVVRNDKDEAIAGNPSEITRVEDEWTFERPVKSRDPNWTIIDT